jgi:hypothetical protein
MVPVDFSRLEIRHGRVGNGVWKAGKVGKLELAVHEIYRFATIIVGVVTVEVTVVRGSILAPRTFFHSRVVVYRLSEIVDLAKIKVKELSVGEEGEVILNLQRVLVP